MCSYELEKYVRTNMILCVFILATKTARKTTKCTIDVKYCESDAALDIYYPPNIEGIDLYFGWEASSSL